jgi:hypothetical protein
VGCYFYSLENRLIDTVGFRLCYNSHKYTPDQDSNSGRSQPRGSLQLLGPLLGLTFVISSLAPEHVINLVTSVSDQATD